MNNLQHVVEDSSRIAMHVAVDLCEQGDFDSVAEALSWLMHDREGTPNCESGNRSEGYDELKQLLRDALNELCAQLRTRDQGVIDYVDSLIQRANELGVNV